jgi:hypothetical protein
MTTGKSLSEKGQQLALFGAGDVWRQQAIQYFLDFLETSTTPFMTENVREYAYSRGFVETQNKKAWGGVVSYIRSKGLIQFVEYRKVVNPTAHSATASVWRKK